MEPIEGTVLVGESFDPVSGRVVVEDGQVAAVEETETDSTDVVVPAFVNAHTHLGDSVAKEAAVGLGLEEAVAPPDSLKHRRLTAADRDELVTAMRRTLRFMERTGTAACLDFREYGVEGARALRDAVEGTDVDPFVFGSGDPAVLDVGRPPIRELLDHTTVALGTDNVMLNPPSMFREMAYTAKTFDVTPREVLRMATTAGAEIAGLDCGVIAPGRRAALTVVDGDSDNLAGATETDPVSAVVRRATALDVDRVVR